HIDVMDGIFVPHISYGEPVVQSIRQYTNLPFDVHLMVEKPESHIDSFAKAGADWITFHIESTVHAHRHLEHIKSLGKKAGISLVPSTPVSIIEEVLPLVDIVLVMTVNPGFGGQKLITSCVNKIRYLKRLKNEKNFSYKISVDGGINEDTYKSAIEAGADILVSGSAFFADKMPSF
ncbi:MAG: ribulose-phosphate 3-epimerase, partial [Treponema sp.]|nr:ribulose-phosphate 3-epimerase [Treponema sp.]